MFSYKGDYVAHLHSYMEVIVELGTCRVTHKTSTEHRGLGCIHSSLISPLIR